MLSISDELNNAFSSTNKEIHVKAEINFSSMELDPSITATSSTAIIPDDTAQLVSGNTQTPCSWATMDGTSDMSGNYCMMPEADSIYCVGYFGSVSGADFSCNETIDITSRERTLSKITIHGDNSRQEYPVDYTIKVYNQAVLLHTETVVGSSSVENEVDFGITIADITKIVINITRYSHASTSVKLIGVQTSLSRIFTGQEIESFEIIEEAEVNNNATIPTGNISYSTASINLVNVNRMFDNANTNSPLYNQLKPNSKIDISVGAKVFKNNVPSVEYVKLYSAWTESFDSKDDSMTTSTVAYDRLKRLDLTNMSPQPTLLNQTAGDLFKLVLNDAGVTEQFLSIDTRLFENTYSLPVYSILGSTHLSELKALSEALSTSVYVTADDVIRIDSIEFLSQKWETQETYSPSDYKSKSNTPLYKGIYNSVVVPYNPYVIQVSKEQYKTPTSSKEVLNIGDTTLTFMLKEKSCTGHSSVLTPISGVSITSSTYYSDRAVIVFNNTTGTQQGIEITINAQYYDSESVKTIQLKDEESIEKYTESEFKYKANKFIQTFANAQNIAEYTLNTYNEPYRDFTVEFEGTGNPALQLTDKIALTDNYGTQSGNIIYKSTRYDGALSMLLKGRKSALNDYTLTDNNGNQIISDTGDILNALTTVERTLFNLTDNNGNSIIDNNGNQIMGVQ